jgi:hypothetical protein
VIPQQVLEEGKDFAIQPFPKVPWITIFNSSPCTRI